MLKLRSGFKTFLSLSVNVALVLSVSQPLLFLPLSAEAATTIFTDGFEVNPPFNLWTVADSKWNINSSELHAGAKAAEVKGDTRPDDDLLSKSVSTVGYENLVLSYWYKAHSLDVTNSDKVVVQYSNDGGSNWVDLFQMDATNDDDQWHQKIHNLPEDSEDNANFIFRFKARLDSAPNDDVWIDDVSLSGDATNDDIEEEPVESGSAIYGLKYNDANGNGLRDDGEEGLADVGVKIYQDDDLIASTVTSWDGHFGFNNLVLGEEYLICEELPAGWQQTDPNKDGGSSWQAEGRKKCDNGTWGYETEVNESEAYGYDFGNVRGGLVSGIKYRDSNNNGAHDDNEPQLGGWTIRLYHVNSEEDGDWSEVEEKTTSWDGYFTFDGLTPGNYVVCEVNPESDDNWQQTDPTENGGSSWRAEDRIFCDEENTWGYQVSNLNWGDENYSYDFGNVPGGVIAGWKYNDANANGERDGVYPTDTDGEKGITNYPIKLYQADDDNEGEWEEVATTYTDSDLWAKGMFYFKGLEPGDYYICEEMPTVGEWIQTDPTEVGGSSWRSDDRVECPNGTWGYKIESLDWGDEEYSYDFGNYQAAAVRVTKIAVPDTGNFNFTLEAIEGPEYLKTLTSVGSTPDGQPLEFLKLLPGVYNLTEEVPADWEGVQTSNCTDGIGEVDPGSLTLTSGLQVNCTFNNSEYGVISGYKFEDENADGVRSNAVDEAGLPGWTIHLYEEGELGLNEIKNTITDDAGFYAFGKLMPGTYYICEEAEGGWTQSVPANGYACPDQSVGYTVEVEAGQIIGEQNFGNWQFGEIDGVKWEDVDGNGEQSEGEDLLSGWTIYLDKNSNSIKDDNEDEEITGDGGAYHFGLIKPGNYLVREVLQGSWVQTYPENGEHNVTVRSGESAVANFGNHFGVIDHEAPNTIITSPNPETEWTESILISGTTTDNVGVASTTLWYAPYTGNPCAADDYSLITVLDNLSLGSVFDWYYSWNPANDGDYCVKANGTDISGNEEHTAVVYPIKFKKVAAATTTPPTENNSTTNNDNEADQVGGGGGRRIINTSTTTSEVTSGNNSDSSTSTVITNLPPVVSPLALAITEDQEGDNSLPDGIVDEDITSTSSNEALTNNLLAAVGGLKWLGNWWFWLILVIIILAIIGGYYYWQKKHHNSH